MLCSVLLALKAVEVCTLLAWVELTRAWCGSARAWVSSDARAVVHRLHLMAPRGVGVQTCPPVLENNSTEDAGELPLDTVDIWESDNYSRPSYTATKVVKDFHGWVRIAGDNDFDVSDEDYGE